ncbi:hypothetical protein EDB87DRAFT_629518 [Lactarius vividus]|nr:hypothetical protein EDB87DRAFT_629518 [Lactarius vividus]
MGPGDKVSNLFKLVCIYRTHITQPALQSSSPPDYAHIMSTPDIIFILPRFPFSQRVEIAFQEAKADVTSYSIDLRDKPEWYAARVNPTGMLPVVVYGSPKSDPEHPSPESAKIAESLVLLEFIADLYPDSGLLPKDPVERARVRFFIDAVSTKLTAAHLRALPWRVARRLRCSARGIPGATPACRKLRCGDHFTIADAAIAPFLARWELRLRNDIGKFEEGTGLRVYKELFQSERFARVQKYYASITSRESFKNSFDPVRLLFSSMERLGRQ